MSDALGEDEMVTGEDGEGDGVEKTAEGEDFVETAGAREFGEDDEGEADGKDEGSGEVWAEDSGRNVKRGQRGSEMRRRQIVNHVADSKHAESLNRRKPPRTNLREKVVGGNNHLRRNR